VGLDLIKYQSHAGSHFFKAEVAPLIRETFFRTGDFRQFGSTERETAAAAATITE